MQYMGQVTTEHTSMRQPIIILASPRKPSTYIDTVTAAALASVLAYATEVVTLGGTDPNWDTWMKGGRQRLVLRASAREFKALASKHSNDEHALIRHGKAQALALQPAGELPKHLSKLAECQATFPNKPTDSPIAERHKDYPVVVVDLGLQMLAGDAAAHASESILSWFMTLSFDQKATWYDTGCLFSVIGLNGAEFTDKSIYSSAENSLSRTPAGRAASFLLPPAFIKVKPRT